MKLGEMITQYRQEHDISQREFARRCGLSNSLISLMEMGINPQTGKEMTPDLETYRKLSYGMRISLQQLFEMLGSDAFVNLNGGADHSMDINAEWYAAQLKKNLLTTDMNSEEHDVLSAYRDANEGIRLAVRKLLDIHY